MISCKVYEKFYINMYFVNRHILEKYLKFQICFEVCILSVLYEYCFAFGKFFFSNLPISSINGAIRRVIPTSSKHMINKRQAVAIIVQRARSGRSSGSMTCIILNYYNNLFFYLEEGFTLTLWSSKLCTRIFRFLCLFFLQFE